MDNYNRDSASRGGIAATRAAGKLAKKGARKIARLIPTKIKVTLIAIFLFIILVASITSLSSVSQSDDFLVMSAAGEEEMNTPPEEDKESALWDKDYARKKTQEFLEIIAEFENEGAENKKTEINSYCSDLGRDELSYFPCALLCKFSCRARCCYAAARCAVSIIIIQLLCSPFLMREFLLE